MVAIKLVTVVLRFSMVVTALVIVILPIKSSIDSCYSKVKIYSCFKICKVMLRFVKVIIKFATAVLILLLWAVALSIIKLLIARLMLTFVTKKTLFMAVVRFLWQKQDLLWKLYDLLWHY